MYGILVDVTKCTACEKCVHACTVQNKLDVSKSERDRAVTTDGLSANRLATVLKVDDKRFARKSCMHCLEPSCVSACLVGGLTKSPEGPVIYDRNKCIGCWPVPSKYLDTNGIKPYHSWSNAICAAIVWLRMNDRRVSRPARKER